MRRIHATLGLATVLTACEPYSVRLTVNENDHPGVEVNETVPRDDGQDLDSSVIEDEQQQDDQTNVEQDDQTNSEQNDQIEEGPNEEQGSIESGHEDPDPQTECGDETEGRRALWLQTDRGNNNTPTNQDSYGGSEVANMLEAQGVTWEVARLDSFSIDPLELMRFDLIIMYGKSEFEPLSDVDAAVLEYWVLQGGGFMYSTFHPTDQSCDMVNSLPENFGISCVPGNQAVSGLGQPVFSHPVNNAVENVSVLGGEHWEVNHPAESIVQDNLGRPIVTATEWGFGRVVGINDEWPLYNTGTGNHDISAEDNGLMVDNALCWLLGDCNEAEVIGDFECDLSIDYVPSLGYNQIGLTDPCEGSFCGTHPVYGETRDIDDAVEYCQDICMNDNGCTGFFFQRHTNGHEICGFYSDGFELQGTSNGHQVGSRVCMKR